MYPCFFVVLENFEEANSRFREKQEVFLRQIKHLKIALVVRPAVALAQPVQLTPWLPEGGTGPSPPQPRRGSL